MNNPDKRPGCLSIPTQLIIEKPGLETLAAFGIFYGLMLGHLSAAEALPLAAITIAVAAGHFRTINRPSITRRPESHPPIYGRPINLTMTEKADSAREFFRLEKIMREVDEIIPPGARCGYAAMAFTHGRESTIAMAKAMYRKEQLYGVSLSDMYRFAGQPHGKKHFSTFYEPNDFFNAINFNNRQITKAWVSTGTNGNVNHVWAFKRIGPDNFAIVDTGEIDYQIPLTEDFSATLVRGNSRLLWDYLKIVTGSHNRSHRFYLSAFK